MNIIELFEARVAERPGQPAIVDVAHARYRIHSYQQLAEDSARVAGLFQDSGIGAGDRVLVLQPMSYELYVVLLALFRLGAVAMFLDPSAGRAHIDQCCEVGQPKALVGGRRAQLLRLVSRGLRRIRRRFVIGGRLPGAVPLERARHSVPLDVMATGGEAPALLTFTSGSTGRPKAAVRTHAFLLAQHAALAAALDLKAGERDLTTLPIFLLANLASGLTSVIPHADLRVPGKVAPRPVLDQVRALGVTRSAGSPSFYQRLVEYCERHDEPLPLGRVDTGGAPVFPPLLNRLQARAPEARVVAVYGSTEAEPMAHVMYAEMRQVDRLAMSEGRGLLTGLPVEEVSLRVIRDRFGSPIGPYDGRRFADEALGTGEIGEIVVTGGHVLPGYVDGEGDAQTKFEVDGRRWHRTGDAGYLDAEGRLWLVGRCSGKIEDARGVVYPFSVECAAQFFAGVRRSAMVSHAGRRLLLVEAPRGFDVEGLRHALAWARLDEVRRVKAIPVDRRHNAKIDYTRLEKLLK